MPTLGDKWKLAREAAGLSAIDAARLAGLHKNTIYDLEKGKDGATLRVMQHVADIYGKSLGEIFAPEAPPETIPVEYRPLAEVLRPLTFEARVSIVKNIAANLNFMASHLIAVSDGSNTRNVLLSDTSIQNDAGRPLGDSTGYASSGSNDGGQLEEASDRNGIITDHPAIEDRSARPQVRMRQAAGGTSEPPKRRGRGVR